MVSWLPSPPFLPAGPPGINLHTASRRREQRVLRRCRRRRSSSSSLLILRGSTAGERRPVAAAAAADGVGGCGERIRLSPLSLRLRVAEGQAVEHGVIPSPASASCGGGGVDAAATVAAAARAAVASALARRVSVCCVWPRACVRAIDNVEGLRLGTMKFTSFDNGFALKSYHYSFQCPRSSRDLTRRLRHNNGPTKQHPFQPPGFQIKTQQQQPCPTCSRVASCPSFPQDPPRHSPGPRRRSSTAPSRRTPPDHRPLWPSLGEESPRCCCRSSMHESSPRPARRRCTV